MTQQAAKPALPSLRTLDDPEGLRDLVQRLKEGIYITTHDGRVLDGNPAFMEMIGVPSLAELRSCNVNGLLVDPEDARRERELLDKHGEVREFELRIKSADGVIRTVLDSAYACRDPRTDETLYRGVLVDITLRKDLENQLVEQSIRDPLTGCYNRRYLRQFEERARNSGWGCLAIDIDHFKQYNDQHGHKAGDVVLVKLSRMLMRHARAEEGVVRMGGDEFVVLLAGADASAAQAAAKRLQSSAVTQAPVSFSLGWAVREKDEKLEKTLVRADRHMFAVRIRHRTPDTERRKRAIGR